MGHYKADGWQRQCLWGQSGLAEKILTPLTAGKEMNTVAVCRFASAELPYVHICRKMGRSTSVVKISGTNSYCITSRLYLDCGELATLSFSCVSAHRYMFCVTKAKRVHGTYQQHSLLSEGTIWCLLGNWVIHLSFWEEFSEILSRAYIGLHVKCLLSHNNQTEISPRIFF